MVFSNREATLVRSCPGIKGSVKEDAQLCLREGYRLSPQQPSFLQGHGAHSLGGLSLWWSSPSSTEWPARRSPDVVC